MDSGVLDTVRRLADRKAPRSEADVQSDVRKLLLDAPLDIDEKSIPPRLEVPVGERDRIDVQAGCAIIEVKRDLSSPRTVETAAGQLAGYVRHRTAETGQRFVGLLTDSADWHLYHLGLDGDLAPVATFALDPRNPDADGLCVWLEGILATRVQVAPTPAEIESRLGASSSAFALDSAELLALYASCKSHPEVALKRELYAKLLVTAFGTQFDNDDALFVEHTLLVTMAKLIAHVVLGIRITDPATTPEALIRGEAFLDARIGGVVDADFFDWILDAQGGETWVRSLARRVARFAWKEADHDVLKVLYESIISTDQRHRLGEYYTPDWLAEHVVAEVVTEPLVTRCAGRELRQRDVPVPCRAPPSSCCRRGWPIEPRSDP